MYNGRSLPLQGLAIVAHGIDGVCAATLYLLNSKMQVTRKVCGHNRS